MTDPVWKKDPEEHDFPAAADYLELLLPPEQAQDAVRRLRAVPTTSRKAKDILRASGLELLSARNPHVAHDMKKAVLGKKLSPVLLLRGRPLLIADGYHRVCAIHYLSEDLEVPCRLA
ncbi:MULTISPECIES: hypothetical protein [Streptomycetaceae]|uniref:hypothetical protein n=1 Tax=Streptomycetaceae TaxID=2062 RepID=UPI00300BF557